jgi:hypothetical protein
MGPTPLHLSIRCDKRDKSLLPVIPRNVPDPGCMAKLGARTKGFCPVIRIRIHLIRIRIQHFRLNTDPDPDLIRIQGFDAQKLEKIYS